MHRVNCLAMRFMCVSVQSFLYGEVQYPLTERAIRPTAELNLRGKRTCFQWQDGGMF